MQSVLSLYSRFEHLDWNQSPERMSLAVAWTRLGSWRREGGGARPPLRGDSPIALLHRHHFVGWRGRASSDEESI
jgi:hypothetical protein